MMPKSVLRSRLALAATIILGLTSRLPAFSAIHAELQFVTVQPTSPLATEPGGNPGSFTLSRAGDTNASLTIPFSLGGTATNGVDYSTIPLAVTLAAGQVSSNIAVTPINEPSATGYKTVILSLPRHGTNFIVASLDRAVVYIVYRYTNVPPAVSIVAPTNGASFLSLPNIEIAANASDSNGWVTAVEFLANGTEIGSVTNNPFSDGPLRPLVLRVSHGSIVPIVPGSRASRFQFVLTNVPPGSYSLTAVATDNSGLQTASEPVTIDVTTNMPVPQTRIINPVNGAEFPDLATINLYAAAGEVGGVVNTVEFLANGASLGVVTNYLAAEPRSQFHLPMQWLPYYFRWTNAPVGSNILTAVATDNNGSKAASAPVNINVTTNIYHRHHEWGW
jgi:hypothetical protein